MAELTDNQVEKSKRDMLLERMAGKYPDRDFSDDNELYSAALDDFGQYDEELGRRQKVDEDLGNMFSNNPQFAGMFLSAIESKNPVVALIEAYGEDFRTYLDDPANAEQLAEANQAYMDRIGKEKDLEATYNANIEASLAVADELEKSGKYNAAQIDEAFKLIFDDAQKAMMGEITAEMLEDKLKGLNYDADVAEAAQIGEVKGKNTKIEAKKKSLKDELPMLEGKSAPASRPVNKTIRSLDNVANKGDIWKDMKRYK